MIHKLKIWPQYFEPVSKGTKTFEVRSNDRGFQPGDTVILQEWNPTMEKHYDHNPMGVDEYEVPIGYTGKFLEFKIGYVYPIDADRVVFSLLTPQKRKDLNDGRL